MAFFSELSIHIRSESERFSSNGVTVTLQWMLVNLQVYYQQLLPNVSVSTNPQPHSMIFTGDMRVQLELSYNTSYVVSVTQHSICEQLIQTAFIELNFSKIV